ncbi:MAG: SnoaL-like polyketide cyclase [Actinomycetota bacterium]|jgi:hypothetical protein|nr:SnoaL-like polyketide cyclase [Actinomycetota bacterium]
MPRGDDYVDQAKALVRSDVEDGFKEMLSSRADAPFAFGLHESDLDDASTFATSEQLVVLPWRYPCTHSGTFLDIPATGVELELRGTTFVDIREDADSYWIYYRYIDFIGALHQIGVPTVARPVASTPDDGLGRTDAPKFDWEPE